MNQEKTYIILYRLADKSSINLKDTLFKALNSYKNITFWPKYSNTLVYNILEYKGNQVDLILDIQKTIVEIPELKECLTDISYCQLTNHTSLMDLLI